MTDRGILFSAPMVRALLAGTKSQTRRAIKPQPIGQREGEYRMGHLLMGPGGRPIACPYGLAGDRLWVRETWAEASMGGAVTDTILYRATPGSVLFLDKDRKWVANRLDAKLFTVDKWRPSIFMPRWASRITLEVTGVRVERVQSISIEDAEAEGLSKLSKDNGRVWKYGIPDRDGLPGTDNDGWDWMFWRMSPVDAYQHLWESINGPGSWESNPWVWVVEFKRVTT